MLWLQRLPLLETMVTVSQVRVYRELDKVQKECGSMTLPDTFNHAINAWKDEQNTPWFRLRYTTIRTNLLRHIGDKPLHILDAGGGNGIEALSLAALGHTITLVDFSAEMLTDARQRADAAGLSDRLIVHEADLGGLPNLFPNTTFDVVLCHNVLQYVSDPKPMLANIAALVRPGGLLSVVSQNRYGETYLAALLQNDLHKALAQLDATTIETTLFKVPVHRFTGEEMIMLLSDLGCPSADQYGVLCVCAYIANNALKYDLSFFAELERLELALTARYPYYLTARFFQVIASKTMAT